MLIIQNLSVKLNNLTLLNDIHLAAQTGEITALLGRSGSGKSTLLRCINQLLPNEQMTLSGSICLHKQELLNAALSLPDLRRRVGMVFQSPSIFPGSIYFNIAYGIRLGGHLSKKELDVRVRQALDAAALYAEVKERLHEPAAALSGGQQQRLCIARALAVEPQVLLLDEPTSALDPLSTIKIERLLQSISSRLIILVVTHNMQQALRIAPKAALLQQGELVEYGQTARIAERFLKM